MGEARRNMKAAHCDRIVDGVEKRRRKTGIKKILKVVSRLGRFNSAIPPAREADEKD